MIPASAAEEEAVEDEQEEEEDVHDLEQTMEFMVVDGWRTAVALVMVES